MNLKEFVITQGYQFWEYVIIDRSYFNKREVKNKNKQAEKNDKEKKMEDKEDKKTRDNNIQ